MSYPVMRVNFSLEEIAENFTLLDSDHRLLSQIRSEAGRLGSAVFLCSLRYLGYLPRRSAIPAKITRFIANQLAVDPGMLRRYRWNGGSADRHLVLIRRYLKLRPPDLADRSRMQELIKSKVGEAWSKRELLEIAVILFREQGLELPRERELIRLIVSARRSYLQEIYATISRRIQGEVLEKMRQCFRAKGEDSSVTMLEWLTSSPGKPGRKALNMEVNKLKTLRGIGLDSQKIFADVPPRIFRAFRNRARGETVAQLRRHPKERQVTLLACLLCSRLTEVSDQVVQLFLDIVRKAHRRGEHATESEVIGSVPKFLNNRKLLKKVVRASSDQPDAAIKPQLIAVLGNEVYQSFLDEQDGPSYELMRTQNIRKRVSVYRATIDTVLEALDFRANNPKYQPLMDGLELVKHYRKSRRSHFAESEAPKAILTGFWRDVLVEEGQINKAHFEVCILGKLEKALKSKEVWVQGTHRFRNPDEDLPADWQENRSLYYERRNLPLDPSTFLTPLRNELESALVDFQSSLTQAEQEVRIQYPGGGSRGIFKLPRIQARPCRPILDSIKERVIGRWGILDLLDILIEADRQVEFIRYFPTSAERQVLGLAETRRRLLLVLFGLGTNMGLKRIHAAAAPDCSYNDLRYFLRRFITKDALREANAALVNRILAVRNPAIWGSGTACASDGKHLGAWEQNPVTEWHPHYDTRGVMVYWHVQTNATCIYSQLKRISASQVASMIEGLVRHDTEMRLESNCVDSHGQSEVAFAFCRILGFKLLPRLKRIKDIRLCIPDKASMAQLMALKGVVAAREPIDWKLIEEQYDEMVRHVVAVAEGTGPTESILRRFNSSNSTNPVYKAFIELGKAEKTRFICRYLMEPEMRREINDALNVVENWNSCVEFICYGRKVELQSNDPEIQELTVLAIHLLQNALVLSNTLMVERVLSDGILEHMEEEDFRALTPLFTSNVNPYGDFELNLDKPSFLDAA